MNYSGMEPKHLGERNLIAECQAFALLLKDIGNRHNLMEVKWVHLMIMRQGLGRSTFLGNVLIDVYGKSGGLDGARVIFEKMHVWNVYSWNAIISTYINNGHCKAALRLLGKMHQSGIRPDKCTIATALSACTELEEGKQIHECSIINGLELKGFVYNALISMYGKCGSIENARIMFDKIAQRNLISWNAMLNAYVQNAHSKDAVVLFREMQMKGVKPSKVTYTIIFEALANLGALEKGVELHKEVMHLNVELDVILGTSIVKMYGKCASMHNALAMFISLPERNIISWNTIIAAYSQSGLVINVLHLFNAMHNNYSRADNFTFVSVLSACSYAGLFQEAHNYFNLMAGNYGIVPTVEHYGCISDLIGRAGRLDVAEDFIDSMPLDPDAKLWTSFLAACRVHGDMKRGKRSAWCLFELDPDNTAPYLLLSGIYA